MTIQEINLQISKEREALLQHSLYTKIKTVDNLRDFMEGHVYAVWDFMSLLKALQQKLTCTTVPWFASSSPQTRYLINEIVLAEESDLSMDGRRLSHFEMYLEAMESSQAQTQEVLNFLEAVKQGKPILELIENSSLHEKIKAFLAFSFGVILHGKTHEIAAAFTFGREDLIPDMFTEILKGFEANFPEIDLSKLIYYFERHIELDGDTHGPLAMQMIDELCGTDAQKWQEVVTVSKEALVKRMGLWDAIELQIDLNRE